MGMGGKGSRREGKTGRRKERKVDEDDWGNSQKGFLQYHLVEARGESAIKPLNQ